MLEDRDHPRGPADGEAIDLVRRPDSDEQPGVVGRLHAHAPLALAVDRASGHLDLDAGPDGVAIAAGPHELEANPAIVGGRVVAEDGGRPAAVVDDDVDVAIVVDVAERRSSADVPRLEVRPGVAGGEPEPLALDVGEKQGGSSSSIGRPSSRRLSSTWPLATNWSGQPSLSRSTSAEPPAHPGQTSPWRARGRRHVEEPAFAEVAIKRVVHRLEVRDGQLGTAVAVDILGVRAHARLGVPIAVVAGARGFRGVLERAVPVVEKDEVRAHVVGDEEVDLAVTVQVGRDDAESLAVGAGPGAGDGVRGPDDAIIDVREGTVAVVPIEEVPGRAEVGRGDRRAGRLDSGRRSTDRRREASSRRNS